MKTKIKTLLSAFALVFVMCNRLVAQTPTCPYSINNASDCTAEVMVDLYDGGITPCKSVLVTVAPNSTQIVTCGSCGPLVDVVVTVTFLGGVSMTGMSASIANIMNPDIGPFSTACTPSGDVYLNWSTGAATIHP